MIDTLIHLFTSGAYLPFAIVIVYELARLIKDDTHWLNQGKAAVYFSAALAALSTLAPIAMTGETPNLKAVVTALVTAYALFRVPTPTAKTAQN